jgi:Clp amino terminal domain, pathogenicity island component
MMFERYSERERRVVFFARYEASQFGSPYIEPDHLLLGLVRDEKLLCSRWLPKAQPDTIRRAIEESSEHHPKVALAIDLPLSKASKDVLQRARAEADALNSRHIGTEHLLLGLLQEKCKASDLLFEMGADVAKLRARFAGDREREDTAQAAEISFMNRVRAEVQKRERFGEAIELHGLRWNRDYILDGAKRCKKYNWHWRRASWKARDVVVNRTTGRVFVRPRVGGRSGELRTRQSRLEKRSLRHLRLGSVRVRRSPRHRIHQRAAVDLRRVLREILGAAELHLRRLF